MARSKTTKSFGNFDEAKGPAHVTPKFVVIRSAVNCCPQIVRESLQVALWPDHRAKGQVSHGRIRKKPLTHHCQWLAADFLQYI